MQPYSHSILQSCSRYCLVSPPFSSRSCLVLSRLVNVLGDSQGNFAPPQKRMDTTAIVRCPPATPQASLPGGHKRRICLAELEGTPSESEPGGLLAMRANSCLRFQLSESPSDTDPITHSHLRRTTYIRQASAPYFLELTPTSLPSHGHLHLSVVKIDVMWV